MAKLGWIIPDDWDQISYTNYLVCVPDSLEWKATFEGCVYLLGRARQYDKASGSVVDAAQIGKEIYFSMADCNDIFIDINGTLEGIRAALSASGCGCTEGGAEVEPGALDEDDAGIGPGEQFPDLEAYLDAKCVVANGIQENIQEIIRQMEKYNVDGKFTTFLSITTGLVAGAVLAGPIGAVAGFAIGVVASFVNAAVGLVDVDFQAIETFMTTNQEDLVCSLYAAGSAGNAKASYLAIVDASTLSAAQKLVFSPLLHNTWLNQLYVPDQSLVGFSAWESWYTPTDCADCDNYDRVEIIDGGIEAGPSGTIVGSDRLQIGDSVIIDSIQELVECPGRHLIALNLVSLTGMSLGADVTITVAGWSNFCVHDPCGNNETFHSPNLDLASPITTIACGVDPGGNYLDIGSFAPRSGTPMQMTITRTA